MIPELQEWANAYWEAVPVKQPSLLSMVSNGLISKETVMDRLLSGVFPPHWRYVRRETDGTLVPGA